jgi:hypothetical protein
VRSRAVLEAVCILRIAVAAGAVFGWTTQRPANSDQFWRDVAFEGVMDENFDSLKEMADSSDVVVTGHFQNLEESRSWVALPELGDDGVAFYAKASVKVDEVVAGAYSADRAGNLGVGSSSRTGASFLNWPARCRPSRSYCSCVGSRTRSYPSTAS